MRDSLKKRAGRSLRASSHGSSYLAIERTWLTRFHSSFEVTRVRSKGMWPLPFLSA